MKINLISFVFALLVVLNSTLVYLHYSCSKLPRFKITELADIVEGVPQHMQCENDPRYNKGYKLSLSVNDFWQRFPDGCSDILSETECGFPPCRLSFQLPEALPAFYQIWDAPMKARLLAWLHGTNERSRIPFVHANPLLMIYDLLLIRGSEGASWQAVGGSSLQKGCYMFSHRGIGPIELKDNCWIVATHTKNIYRLKKNCFYKPDTYPRQADWELVIEKGKAVSKYGHIAKLPFGTYLFASGECFMGATLPPTWIQVISVNRIQ